MGLGIFLKKNLPRGLFEKNKLCRAAMNISVTYIEEKKRKQASSILNKKWRKIKE